MSTAYNTWQENLLTIDVVSPSVVVFELNLGQGTGLLALDDIQFIPCSGTNCFVYTMSFVIQCSMLIL